MLLEQVRRRHVPRAVGAVLQQRMLGRRKGTRRAPATGQGEDSEGETDWEKEVDWWVGRGPAWPPRISSRACLHVQKVSNYPPFRLYLAGPLCPQTACQRHQKCPAWKRLSSQYLVCKCAVVGSCLCSTHRMGY